MDHSAYDSKKEMGSVGLNIQGTTFNDFKVNLIAEEQSERQSKNYCPHEWNEKNQTCCFCKGNGQFAVDCPVNDKESEIICLKCGNTRHEMFSCNNDYCPHDLTKIRCHACNESGHIFCGSFVDINQQVVSCFNCGKTGHTGSQCSKSLLDKRGSKPPSWSYDGEQVGSLREDAFECAIDVFQTHDNSIPVELKDLHSASSKQDVAVDCTTMNIRVQKSFSFMHLTAEEHSEDTCQHHELNEKVETVLMAPAEDLSPIKIDAEHEEFFEEASISILQQQQQQSAYQDPSVSKLKSKSILSFAKWNMQRRYFDFETSSIEEPVINSLAHMPCKPCYFCGQFHAAKRCPKNRACYFCKGKGHFAVHCPINVKERDRFCLKCGEKGHEMFSCNIDYCHDDLTKIHCYACDKLGHLFCGSITDTNLQALSCFNCGDTQHNGLQCPKPHLKCGSRPPPLCYNCGEPGHAARNCQNDATDSRPCEDIQGTALLVAAVDDGDVQQSRKRARRSKAYKHGRLKTHKLRQDSS